MVRTIADVKSRPEPVVRLELIESRQAEQNAPMPERNLSLSAYGVPQVPVCPQTPTHHRLDFTLVAHVSRTCQ